MKRKLSVKKKSLVNTFLNAGLKHDLKISPIFLLVGDTFKLIYDKLEDPWKWSLECVFINKRFGSRTFPNKVWEVVKEGENITKYFYYNGSIKGRLIAKYSCYYGNYNLYQWAKHLKTDLKLIGDEIIKFSIYGQQIETTKLLLKDNKIKVDKLLIYICHTGSIDLYESLIETETIMKSVIDKNNTMNDIINKCILLSCIYHNFELYIYLIKKLNILPLDTHLHIFLDSFSTNKDFWWPGIDWKNVNCPPEFIKCKNYYDFLNYNYYPGTQRTEHFHYDVLIDKYYLLRINKFIKLFVNTNILDNKDNLINYIKYKNDYLIKVLLDEGFELTNEFIEQYVLYGKEYFWENIFNTKSFNQQTLQNIYKICCCDKRNHSVKLSLSYLLPYLSKDNIILDRNYIYSILKTDMKTIKMYVDLEYHFEDIDLYNVGKSHWTFDEPYSYERVITFHKLCPNLKFNNKIIFGILGKLIDKDQEEMYLNMLRYIMNSPHESNDDYITWTIWNEKVDALNILLNTQKLTQKSKNIIKSIYLLKEEIFFLKEEISSCPFVNIFMSNIKAFLPIRENFRKNNIITTEVPISSAGWKVNVFNIGPGQHKRYYYRSTY